jgi:hypothetical protein
MHIYKRTSIPSQTDVYTGRTHLYRANTFKRRHYIYMYTYIFIHMYVYVCMYVCICMCICMYVYTCYVLTKPPIPSSRCKHFVFLRPNKILITESIYICIPGRRGCESGGWREVDLLRYHDPHAPPHRRPAELHCVCLCVYACVRCVCVRVCVCCVCVRVSFNTHTSPTRNTTLYIYWYICV